MNQLNQLIVLILIAITTAITYWGFSNQFVFQRYQFQVGAILHHKQYRRLISSAFLHADWTHLLFNMLTLYFFSPVIIDVYGVMLYFILYFAAVLAGNLFSLWLYQKRPSYAAIGASGGVSGIIFASIALMPLSSIYLFFIPIPIPAWLFATLYFAYSVWQMLNPKPWDNQGHAAHIGGAAIGIIFALLLTPHYVLANSVLYLGIMLLPLLYLAYELLVNKKVR